MSAVACICLLVSALPAAGSQFERTGELLHGRDMGMAATLPDGRVLVAGGIGIDAEGIGYTLHEAELYDPATGGFARTGDMRQGRDGNATHTVLADGRVLFAGGTSESVDGDRALLASAEIYDPATGRFERTAADMASPRMFHTATLLDDGRVLIAGGWGPDDRLASAELFDPATGRFSPVGDMTVDRNAHTATRLADGRVLIAGGLTTDAPYELASAELFDPATGTFSATGGLAAPRFMATASPLPDGRVLVAGGLDNGAWRPFGEIYDPATGAFSVTGALNMSRHDHGQLLLPDGRVLVVAGNGDAPLASAELYDAQTGRFSHVADMTLGRARPATALLQDGRVLVAGGVRPWEAPLAIAELFVPGSGPTTDLAVRMQASRARVAPGARFHYALTIANLGPMPAEDAAVDIALSPHLAIGAIQVLHEPSETAPWECTRDGTSIACTPRDGQLRPGRDPRRPSVALRIEVQAPGAAPDEPLHATAIASSSNPDGDLGNNTATAEIRVDGGPSPDPMPRLRQARSTAPGAPEGGAPAWFRRQGDPRRAAIGPALPIPAR
ncbi:kelch repeat-containing protein [Luteimonas sp. RD2P54]|uniref:Kelch repeat-containing protein n=1 Tax=Luteimonas endophytica TaxID=3042023 RepID=A0ABT6JAG7_9GAMM|nr:kelch repeat-containing protein [Luteimonas endophytica]MDH5823582.1 kelch repeat-containing protein [Luteimonas endophytica]